MSTLKFVQENRREEDYFEEYEVVELCEAYAKEQNKEIIKAIENILYLVRYSEPREYKRLKQLLK